MPRKRRPSDVAAKARRESGQHRTLVYVDDGGGRGFPNRWGYYCLDCPETGTYSTQGSAQRSSEKHKARTRQSAEEKQDA